eukprot:TRINITY_DN1207_c0_g1_i3.p1 TRINITY_DN1207_c0_g1~~TRINITY_DN1207_c0_g1_i3.p1  ORF type:complete len:196 (+),score=39.27 TRINITY_DN1207_c0_g1_i3:349-936(+)
MTDGQRSGQWEGVMPAADYKDVNPAAKDVGLNHDMLLEDYRNVGLLASEGGFEMEGTDREMPSTEDLQNVDCKERCGRPSPVFGCNYQSNILFSGLEAPKGQDCWESPNLQGKITPVVQLQSMGAVNENEGGIFCLQTKKHCMNGVGEDFSFSQALGEVAAVEDIASSGKGEHCEGVEVGDNSWEGEMFPFYEED